MTNRCAVGWRANVPTRPCTGRRPRKEGENPASWQTKMICRLTLTIPGMCGPEGGDSERGDRRHALLLDPTSLTSRVECVHLFVRESTARTRHKTVVSAQRKIMLGAGTRNFRLCKSRIALVARQSSASEDPRFCVSLQTLDKANNPRWRSSSASKPDRQGHEDALPAHAATEPTLSKPPSQPGSTFPCFLRWRRRVGHENSP